MKYNNLVNKGIATLALFLCCTVAAQAVTKPAWVNSPPKNDAAVIYMVGTGEPMPTVAAARNASLEDARHKYAKFFGEYVESRSSGNGTFNGKAGDVLNFNLVQEETFNRFAASVIAGMEVIEYFTESSQNRYTVHTLCKLDLQMAEGRIAEFAKRIAEYNALHEKLNFDRIPVLSTNEEMDNGIKKTIERLETNLPLPLEVKMGIFVLTGNSIPAGLSDFLAKRIKHFAVNKLKIVEGDRGQDAILGGSFSRRGDVVDVFLELTTTKGGDVLGSQAFSLSAELTQSIGIATEQKQVFTAVAGGTDQNASQTAESIHIKAWFANASMVYRHRDELKMKLVVDHDAFVKVYHIDADNKIKLIFPHALATDNKFFVGVPRDVFDASAKYYLYGPYGAEEIMVVASATQFPNLEKEYVMPWTAVAVRGNRGGEVEMAGPFAGAEGVAKYTITMLQPHEEKSVGKPDMAQAVEKMRSNALRHGGVFDGTETSGCYEINGVRTSYRVPREKPDTLQYAVYYLK